MAIGAYADGSTGDITDEVVWASSDTSVATIDSLGLARGKAPGSTSIRATQGDVTISVTLNVIPAPVLQTITVTPAGQQLAISTTRQYTATGSYSNGTTPNITATVTWASSDTAVATISAQGIVTTIAAGTTTISATLGVVTGDTTLTVVSAAPTPQSITVTPANPTVAPGATQQFTATANYADTSTLDVTGQVTWSSGTTSVATISTAGLASGVAVGASTITATLGTVSGDTTLTVAVPAWAPPPIPASHFTSSCNACHQTGSGGAPQWPTTHNNFANFTGAGFTYTQDTCNTCHQATGAPPNRPAGHFTAGCPSCHSTGAAGAPQWPPTHTAQGFTEGICNACHTYL